LTTVFENIPQFGFQLFFMIQLNIVTGTVLVATFSSVFNILLSIMSCLILRATHKNQIEIPFEVMLSWTIKNTNARTKLSPYSMAGRRKRLQTTLYQMDSNNSVKYEILSSRKKGASASIFGVVKAETDCIRKHDIQNFFDKNLKNAILDAFGYENKFTDQFVFTVRVQIGLKKEIRLSAMTKEYLPKIWNAKFFNFELAKTIVGVDSIEAITNDIAAMNSNANDSSKHVEIELEEATGNTMFSLNPQNKSVSANEKLKSMLQNHLLTSNGNGNVEKVMAIIQDLNAKTIVGDEGRDVVEESMGSAEIMYDIANEIPMSSLATMEVSDSGSSDDARITVGSTAL